MKQNLDILDFTLSADDMARIKTLDTDKPFLLGSHEDPEIVKWFMQYKTPEHQQPYFDSRYRLY